jgi:hypothetical protein
MTCQKLFLAALLLLPALAAFAAEPKLEAQLIWAASTTNAPTGKLKAVDADVQHKLDSLPLKWTKFYEMNREAFTPAATETKRVVLSDKCTLEVRHTDGDKFEVALIGNHKPVWTGVQPLPRGEILVLGGNAPDASAWLVTLKRLE